MDFIPDPIQLGEMRCERWLDKAEQPDGAYKCSCGNKCQLDDMMPASDNPYAEPICPECFEKLIKYWENK